MKKAALIYPNTKLAAIVSTIGRRERDLAIGQASRRVEGLRETAGEGMRDAVSQLEKAGIPSEPEALDTALLLLDRVSMLASLFEVAHMRTLADDLADLWMADEASALLSEASEIYLKAMRLLVSADADEDEIARVLAEIARLRVHLGIKEPAGGA
jgi:hypothetical protein